MASVNPRTRRARASRGSSPRSHIHSQYGLKNDRAFIPLFSDLSAEQIGGGFRHWLFKPEEGDHEVWLDYVMPKGRCHTYRSATQTLNVVVLDVTGEDSVVGIQLKLPNGESEIKRLRRLEFVSIEPGTEFQFFSFKDSGAYLYCTADHGFTDFVEILEEGSEHLLDDLAKLREASKSVPEVAKEFGGYRMTQDRKERIAAAVARKRQTDFSEGRTVSQAHVASTSPLVTRGVNPKPAPIPTE